MSVWNRFKDLFRPKNRRDDLSILYLNALVKNLLERIDAMKLNLDALTAEVARVQTVHASTVVLLKELTAEIERISAKLAEAAAVVPPEPVDTSELDALVAKLKESTDSLSKAVADSADVKGTKEVVLNADNPEVPTVKVILPEVLPEVVTATVEHVTPVTDAASEEPQVVIKVEAATEEVLKDENKEVVTDVIKTEEGLTDVVVAAPAEVHEEVKAETGVDIVEAVKEAYEAAPEVEAAPEAIPAPEAPVEAPAETASEPAPEAPVAEEAPAVEEPAVEAPAEPVAEPVAEEAPKSE